MESDYSSVHVVSRKSRNLGSHFDCQRFACDFEAILPNIVLQSVLRNLQAAESTHATAWYTATVKHVPYNKNTCKRENLNNIQHDFFILFNNQK
jgi:hypothetical protein